MRARVETATLLTNERTRAQGAPQGRRRPLRKVQGSVARLLRGADRTQHLRFKHPGFAEEKEWRLIKLVDVREELSLLDHLRSEEMARETREQLRALGVE